MASPLRHETLETAGSSHAILFGAVGGPKWDDSSATVRPEQGLLDLRKALGLFVNIRPVKVFPDLMDSSVVKPKVLEGVDMVVVRELTGAFTMACPRGAGAPSGVGPEWILCATPSRRLRGCCGWDSSWPGGVRGN